MREQQFDFEFGGNVKLKRYVDSWKKHENYRGFVIVAPSGSGKTALLHKLSLELPKVSYIMGFQLLEQMYEDIKKGRLYRPATETYEVLLIDELDAIEGREATTNEVCYRIKRGTYNSKGDTRLIVCTFIDEKAAIDFAGRMNYELIFLKEVKPNLRIVKDKARDFAFVLDETQIRDCAQLGSMLELRCKFREMERMAYMEKRINSESKPYKLILTSKGLNTNQGKELVRKVYDEEEIEYGSIFLMTFPEYEVDEIVVRNCKELGYKEVYLAKDFEGKTIGEMPEVEAIFVTEGNTFEVMDYLRNNHFDEYIKKMVEHGVTYIGSSAGAMLAAGSFKEAINFDSNFVEMKDFTGFGLMPREGDLSDTVLPHYTYQQLQNYIGTLSDEEKSHYRMIHNISNEEALIMDCKRNTVNVEMLRKRRIRVE